MTKYLVSVDHLEYLQGLEIEADNEEQAQAKYLDKVEYGDVPAINGDYVNLQIKKIDIDKDK